MSNNVIGHIVFDDELKLIDDIGIRRFTASILDDAPQAYFIREASSTNKYHPPSSRGFQGLVRHVKRCVYVADQLLRNDVYGIKLKEYKDFIISALLLHDAKKYGDNNNKWSLKNHADLAAYWIADRDTSLITEEQKKMIAQLVQCHMGQWGRVEPTTLLTKFVHLCDYIASLKELEKEVTDMPVKEMAQDAKALADNPEYIQLKLDFSDATTVADTLTEQQKINDVLANSNDDFIQDILSES